MPPSRDSSPDRADSGHQWFASDEARALLVAAGLSDLDAAFASGKPLDAPYDRRGMRHAYKEVVALEVSTPRGPERVYIKRQWRMARWIPRFTDLRCGVGLASSPMCEWRGLHLLRAAGLDVSEPLALFWRGRGWSRAAVVTRAVPPAHSLADLLARIDDLFADDFHAVGDAMLRVIQLLRTARLAWRSMKPKHFYPEHCPDGSWRMWLIDCEGVHARASRRDLDRDLRTLLASLARVPNPIQAELTKRLRGLS